MVKDDIISFDRYNRQVLDVKADTALIITKDIIDLRWYHNKFIDITWADCSLRAYLNNEFYSQFGQGEKSKILAVTNQNHQNPWFKTKGGQDTTDYIFLLNLEEASEYFGDNKTGLQNKGRQKWLISDENDWRRQAKYGDTSHWWGLRSPGYYGKTAAGITSNGHVYVRGNGVYGKPKDGGGIRPALWLKWGG